MANGYEAEALHRSQTSPSRENPLPESLNLGGTCPGVLSPLGQEILITEKRPSLHPCPRPALESYTGGN